MSPLTSRERRQLSELIELALAHRTRLVKGRDGLSLAALEALLVVARDGPLAQAGVVKTLERDRAAVSRAVEQLLGEKLIRSAQPGVKRPVYEVTAKGLATVRAHLQ
jgi:DNA-binding MarR family transcriptional regulator